MIDLKVPTKWCLFLKAFMSFQTGSSALSQPVCLPQSRFRTLPWLLTADRVKCKLRFAPWAGRTHL